MVKIIGLNALFIRQAGLLSFLIIFFIFTPLPALTPEQKTNLKIVLEPTEDLKINAVFIRKK